MEDSRIEHQHTTTVVLTPQEQAHLERAFQLAKEAVVRGDAPFGAVLIGSDGRVLGEAGNTTATARDRTGHAETNVVREASRAMTDAELRQCTLYASTEPCAMCAGAIFWSGVGRLVFGLSAQAMAAVMPHGIETMNVSCRSVLSSGTHPVEIIGPVYEDARARFPGLCD